MSLSNYFSLSLFPNFFLLSLCRYTVSLYIKEVNFSLISLSLLNMLRHNYIFLFCSPLFLFFSSLFLSYSLSHYLCMWTSIGPVKICKTGQRFIRISWKSYNMISGWIRIVQFSDIRRSLIWSYEQYCSIKLSKGPVITFVNVTPYRYSITKETIL